MMLLNKRNMFGITRSNPNSQLQNPPWQSGGSNYPQLGRGLQKFLPMIGGKNGFPVPPGLARFIQPQQPHQPNTPVKGNPITEEQPKKGVKGFISNLMDRVKK